MHNLFFKYLNQMNRMLHADWPFAEPKNVAVLTTCSIVELRAPILHVTHDKDDGMWQFHSGQDVALGQAMVVALSEVLALDASIAELADLPLGAKADRESSAKPWVRS